MNSAAPYLPLSPLPITDPEWTVLRQRDALRLAMIEQRFDEVEETFDALEAEWWRVDDDAMTTYELLVRAPALFDFATIPAKVRVERLRAWNAAYPNSYHARLVLGRYYYGRAGDIRTASWASEVSQEQWVAAMIACALAAEHLLDSITLSERPAIAAHALMEMSLHFGEPDFVGALFRGEAPGAPTSREEIGAELFDAALIHLGRHAIVPPTHFPIRLPPTLPSRLEGEAAKPADYWLRFARQVKPQWAYLMSSYANYLTPRWGGEAGEVEKFVKGPLCASLTERQRNVVRWPGVIDELGDYPEPGNSRAIQAYRNTFDRWLAREMPDHLRFAAMGQFANFITYSLEDAVKAHKQHVVSVRYCHAPYLYTEVEGPFRDFARFMLMFGMADDEGAFGLILQRAVRWFEEPTMLVIAAVGYRFGRWNLTENVALATAIIDRAAELAGHYEPDAFPPLAVCRMLWDGGAHEEAVYLASELAARRVYEASAFMYDVRRGWLPDTEPHYLDETEKLHWLDRAAEEGVSTALYNKAYRLENVDSLDMAERANFERVRRLYEGAMEQGIPMAMIRLASLLRRHGTQEEKQQAVAEMKHLTTTDDDELAGQAYGEVVLAYKYGDGVPRSEYVAMQWFDRFKELLPNHSTLEWLESQVYGDSGWQMAGRALRAFFGSKPSADHLPPK